MGTFVGRGGAGWLVCVHARACSRAWRCIVCVCVCTVSVRVLKKTNSELSRRDQSAASTVRKVDAGFTVKSTLLRGTVTQARRHAAAAADKASVTTTAVGVGSGRGSGR